MCARCACSGPLTASVTSRSLSNSDSVTWLTAALGDRLVARLSRPSHSEDVEDLSTSRRGSSDEDMDNESDYSGGDARCQGQDDEVQGHVALNLSQCYPAPHDTSLYSDSASLTFRGASRHPSDESSGDVSPSRHVTLATPGDRETVKQEDVTTPHSPPFSRSQRGQDHFSLNYRPLYSDTVYMDGRLLPSGDQHLPTDRTNSTE